MLEGQIEFLVRGRESDTAVALGNGALLVAGTVEVDVESVQR